MIIRSWRKVPRSIIRLLDSDRSWTASQATPSQARVPFSYQSRHNSDNASLSRQELKNNQKKRKQLDKQLNSTETRVAESVAAAAKWELTVGIEIHAELDTERKLFSSALTTTHGSDTPPNTNVALHDLAYPGAQPVFQIATVLPAIRAALALGCTVHRKSAFDRKHYFYADQPAGYQITQFYKPFATDGQVTLSAASVAKHGATDSESVEDVVVGIERVQLEQDTAKSLVGANGTILLDFNRVSHPLIEIVSRPHIHSPKAAAAYVRKVQEMLKAVGAVTAGMEAGGLRADVNVSVRPRAAEALSPAPLGQKTEIKNLSSLKAIEDAVTAEKRRQIEILENGGTIGSETRGWTIGASETHLLRVKEGEVDYRYMPDPDIPPLILSDRLVQMLRDTSPMLPEQIIKEVQERFDINESSARLLYHIDDGARLEYLAEVVNLTEQLVTDEIQRTAIRKLAGNFVIHEIPSLLKKNELEWTEPTSDLIPDQSLALLLVLLNDKKLHNQSAKTLLSKVLLNTDSARARSIIDVAKSEGLLRSDEEASTNDSSSAVNELINEIAQTVFAANEKMVSDILVKKETKKIDYFAGQVMRELGKQGKAKTVNPKHVSDLVRELFWAKFGESQSTEN